MSQVPPMPRTGAEHYAEASHRLRAHREQSVRLTIEGALTEDDFRSLNEALLSAQAHATLAVADALFEIAAQLRSTR